MKGKFTLGLVALALPVFLAGCESTSTPPPSTAVAPVAEQPMRTGSAQDEAACTAAVQKETQTSDLEVLSSEFSEANTVVVIGVGPTRAKWRCLVSKGRVAEVMSLTDEGAL